MVKEGMDAKLPMPMRIFVYLAHEHSEDAKVSAAAVDLLAAAIKVAPEVNFQFAAISALFPERCSHVFTMCAIPF